jgi:hypothetical protein
MQRHQIIALLLSTALVGGCQTHRPQAAPAQASTADNGLQGTVVGDDRTAMEAAIETPGAPATPPPPAQAPQSGVVLAPNAPDSYVVKHGDTLWGIAKVFLRDPWFWPEIWQINPQIKNPHWIYPGDTLRLVYINGQPKIVLQPGLERGNGARVLPRVRSQPLEAAVTTIPYETVAAFMSKPSVLDRDLINNAPYVLATRNQHIVMSDGDTLYARGFRKPVELGTHYNVVRVGATLRDPDDKTILGYNGVFTGTGHVTRTGDPATLIMTESTRETYPGDKLFPGDIDVPLDFVPSPPRTKIHGSIIAVSDGVTIIGQYHVVIINRGVRDGLVPGNVLAVYTKGATVRDTARQGFLTGVSSVFAERVRLPDERSGTFMVFKTFDRMSYGLIMEATNIIRVLDRVESP